MVPAFASEEIAAAIPGAELVMFDTGHALMIEEMDLFNQTVRRFLDSLQDAG
jgi:pimeloyl-ACP methyl ester carboxylesterase